MAKRTRKNPYREKFVKEARIKIRNIVATACTNACAKLEDAANTKNAKAIAIYVTIKGVIQDLADLGVFEKYEDVQDCLYKSLGIIEAEEEHEEDDSDDDSSVIDDLKGL